MLNLFILFGLFLCSVLVGADDTAALRECGNLHHLEFHLLPNASAQYTQSGCRLKCTVGTSTLSDDVLNDGYVCPLNPNGKCHTGECIVQGGHSDTDAQKECGNILHIDFHGANSSGTLYSDSQCFIKCMLNGQSVMSSAINEGYKCPANQDGICQNGHCVVDKVTTPMPEIATVDKLTQIEVVIETAHFTERYFGPYAAMCIDSSGSNPEIATQPLECKAFCTTNMVLQLTDRPIWETKCHFTGPFTTKDIVQIQTLYDGNHISGYFEKTLSQIFDQHYHEMVVHGVPGHFSKAVHFDLTKATGMQSGDIQVQFIYWFTAAQQVSTTPTATTVPSHREGILSDHYIDQIDIQVISGAFNSAIYTPYVALCIHELTSEEVNSQLLDYNDCKTHCSTPALSGRISSGRWNSNCSLHGPITERDSLIVQVRYLDQHLQVAGSFVQNVAILFEQQYAMKSHPNVTTSFFIEEKLALHENAAHVADIWVDLGMNYFLKPKH